MNGNYGPSAADPAKFATACGATTPTDLLYHSNHKCSDRAMFLFDMTGRSYIFIIILFITKTRPCHSNFPKKETS